MNAISDFVLAFADVVGSTTDNDAHALYVDVKAIGSLDLDESVDDDSLGEVSPQSETYGALGILARPPDPETKSGKKYACEVVVVRTEDGLIPIAWRDHRLNQAFPNGIPNGRVSMVGYGGGYHAIDLSEDGNSIHTIYASYANGTKAMALVLDTEGEHISMSIGSGPPTNSGFQLTINETDGLQVRTPNQNTYFGIREDEIHCVAKKIFLKGNVYAGAQAEAGVVLAAGTASPPCPSLFVSPA